MVELVLPKFVVIFGLLIVEGTAKTCRGKRFAKKVVDTPPSRKKLDLEADYLFRFRYQLNFLI